MQSVRILMGMLQETVLSIGVCFTQSEQSLGGRRSALVSSKSRRRPSRCDSPTKRVVFPDEPTTPSTPAAQPDSESEGLGQRSTYSQTFRTSSTGTPWSTFGSSLDAILSTPVVARISASSSFTDDATLHATAWARNNMDQHMFGSEKTSRLD
ncbi:hypothetical protein MRX96_047985 [Rhipicephalus microplus]